ncbi:hypothetical protein GCM10027446_13860 [Angustibacter peucedani]
MSEPATPVEAGTGRQDLAGAARSGLVGLAGSGVAAVAGLLLNVVVGRTLGATGSGLFFVAVALVTVLGTVTKLGADTGAVWALSRAAALGRSREAPTVVRWAVLPGLAASAVASLAVELLAGPLARVLADDHAEVVERALRTGAPFLLVVAPFFVLAASLRGLGSIVPFTALQNVLVPALRPFLVGLAVAVGAGVAGAVVAWSVPFVVGTAVAVALVQRRASAAARRTGDPPRERRAVAAELWRFSAPRSAASVLEIAITWADVLIVAALASPRDAGIYAAASRFITTGTLAEAAMRVALSPRVSRLLAVHDLRGAGELNATATQWIVLLSWPLYLGLACYGSVALAAFGPEFAAGTTPLTVLSLAMLLVMTAGNSQTVLLMSGRSLVQMANKGVALAVNLGLNVWLVPRLGMQGAAIAWAATVLVDAGLVVWQVRHSVGVRTPMARVVPAAVISLAAFVPFGLLTRALFGTAVGPNAVGLGCSLVVYAALVWWRRHTLDVEPLRQALAVRGRRAVSVD